MGSSSGTNTYVLPHWYFVNEWPFYYYILAECGDYVVEDYPDHTYLSSYKFVPHQDHELERKIMENHKKHM